MARKMARQAAMQLLYEQLSGGGGEADDESLDLVYEQLSMAEKNAPDKLRPTEDDRDYIKDVLSGVEKHAEELDHVIEEHSTGEWAMSRMPYVDLSILRLSAYEIFFRADVPDNVAISEAMELAERYSEPKSSRYINGVLGAIGRSKREG